MIAFADARATIVTQLETDLAAAGWSVYGSPPDSFDPPAVILALQTDDRINPSTWRRDLIVGLFVRRDPIAESFDLLDDTIPTLVASLVSVPGVTVGTVSLPEPVTWTDVSYLARFVPMTIETTP
jgi:hypothetical protein